MPRNEDHAQVAIIGAGPGGYQAAFRAADLGLEVTLIDENSRPGGVCLNRGCIPSKTLLHASHMVSEAEEAGRFGISFSGVQVDTDKLRSWKESVIDTLTSGLDMLCKQKKVTFVQGKARFKDRKTLLVETSGVEERALGFEYAIIASGSRPVDPFGVGSSLVMDSTGALELEEIPDKLLVVGGGYIGLELGQVYAGLGSQVSVVEMMPSILAGPDSDLVRFLRRRIDAQFSSIRCETSVRGMQEKDGRVEVTLASKDGSETTETYGRVLVAVGRKPYTDGLGLENTSVEVAENGFIVTDDQRRTAEENIFAVGDAVSQPMLAHKAYYEASVVAEVIVGEPSVYDARTVPAVVFTDPEIAWCGLTQTEAKERGMDVKIARFPWTASGRAVAIGRTDGMTKLVADPGSGRILGVGIAGHGASELIAEGALAVEMAADIMDLSLTIHAHPTLSETIKEAAEILHKSK